MFFELFLFDSNWFEMQVTATIEKLQLTFSGYKIQSNILYLSIIKFKLLTTNNLIEIKSHFYFEIQFLFLSLWNWQF